MTIKPDYQTLIIGAGFSGIGAAIKLDQAGFRNYLLVEAGDGVGGTWHWNTYPGIAVDIPSASYQYSFEQRPDWSRTYALGIAAFVVGGARVPPANHGVVIMRPGVNNFSCGAMRQIHVRAFVAETKLQH